MRPKRIQWNRTMGKLPEGAVLVTRQSRWGNPFTVAAYLEAGHRPGPQARETVVRAFRDWLQGDNWACGDGNEMVDRRARILRDLPLLRGRDLACTCPLDGLPCHGDVLLEMAMKETA